MTERTRRRIAWALAILSAVFVLALFWAEGRRDSAPARAGSTATAPNDEAYRRLDAANRRYARALDDAEDGYFAKKADIERRGGPAAELRAAETERFRAIQAAGREHDAAAIAYAQSRDGARKR